MFGIRLIISWYRPILLFRLHVVSDANIQVSCIDLLELLHIVWYLYSTDNHKEQLGKTITSLNSSQANTTQT